MKTAVHGIAGVSRTLNVVLQVHGPSLHDLAGAIDREHLLPPNVPVEVHEHVKLVAWIPGDEHGTERKANVRVIQKVVRMSRNACILYNRRPRPAGLVKQMSRDVQKPRWRNDCSHGKLVRPIWTRCPTRI